MAFGMSKCRVTVLRRSVDRELADEFLEEEYQGMGPCECFEDSQEIVIEDYGVVPEGFCPSAWADIRKDLFAVAMGANIPGIRQAGTAVSSCADWFRPVLFKIERMPDD